MAVKEKELISIENHKLQIKYRKSFVVFMVFAIIDILIALPLTYFGASCLPYDIVNISDGITLGAYDAFKLIFMDILPFLTPIAIIIFNIAIRNNIFSAKATDNSLIKSKRLNYAGIFFMFPMIFIYWAVILIISIL